MTKWGDLTFYMKHKRYSKSAKFLSGMLTLGNLPPVSWFFYVVLLIYVHHIRRTDYSKSTFYKKYKNFNKNAEPFAEMFKFE